VCEHACISAAEDRHVHVTPWNTVLDMQRDIYVCVCVYVCGEMTTFHVGYASFNVNVEMHCRRRLYPYTRAHGAVPRHTRLKLPVCVRSAALRATENNDFWFVFVETSRADGSVSPSHEKPKQESCFHRNKSNCKMYI